MTFGSRTPRRYAIHARVMEDRVHPTDRIHLLGQLLCINGTAEISNHDTSRSRNKIRNGSSPGCRSSVQDDFMAVLDEGSGCSIAEPIRAAGNENKTHVPPQLTCAGIVRRRERQNHAFAP